MPIRPYLEGRAFDPEAIAVMSGALAAACNTLGLRDKEDGAVQILALRIINQAEDGIRDPESLKAAALRGFRD